MSHLKYRPEIDGLRALAVLPVLLYHARLPLGGGFIFEGGYLGVDVFFVISGYLIAALIWKEKQSTGQFSFANFYLRRARRLLPILLAVMVVTIIMAWRVLLPEQMLDLAASTAATLLFVSNFYWYSALSDYGAEDALLRPLVHTWSLGVEEQFYLVFPVFLLLLAARGPRHTLRFLLLVAALSFAFAVWASEHYRELSFFLLPSRAWELAAGASLAIWQSSSSALKSRQRFAGTLAFLGFVLILLAYVYIPYDRYHPGWLTLVPVLGTLLFLANAGPGNLVGRIASWPIFTGVGLISYSLYLWHYPVFAVLRQWRGVPDMHDWLLATLLTFALAIVGYWLIERPCRNPARVSTRVFGPGLVIVSSLLFAVSVWIHTNEGAPQRMGGIYQLYGENQPSNAKLRQEAWSVLAGLAREAGYIPNVRKPTTAFESEHLWFSAREDTKKVLVLGDSHAKDVFNALYLNQPSLPGYEFALYSIWGPGRQDLEDILATPNFQAADVVLISFRLRPERGKIDWLDEVLDLLQAQGKPLLLMTSAPEFAPVNGRAAFDGMVRSGVPLDTGLINGRFWELQDKAIERSDLVLRDKAEQRGIPLINKTDIICNRATRSCEGVTPQGLKSFYDYGHWTLNGAEHFGRKIADQDLLGIALSDSD